MSENSPLNRDNDSRDVARSLSEAEVRNVSTVSDSTTYSPTPANVLDIIPEAEISESEQNNQFTTEQINSDDKTDTSAEETEPVVVRRQIIQRQTVVVRDTIYIIE